MTGLSKITDRILNDARADAQKLLDAADQECARIAEKAKLDAADIRAEIETDARREAEEILNRARSSEATVSRDIKELRLTKVAARGNRYKYAVLDSDDPKQAAKFVFIMKETVLSVQSAQNLLVIKTFSGMAQAAAAALDNLFGNEVIGTIAGDDTIFAVTASTEDALVLQGKITAELNLSK